MKIALLNLSVDNNFGGNLQRFALIKVLQSLGHDVVFLNLRTRYKLDWYKYPYSYTKRLVKRYVLGEKIPIRYEAYKSLEMEKLCEKQKDFFDKYIPHSRTLYKIEDLKKEVEKGYDALIVGSDQVWRKRMTRQIGLKNYFLDFLGKSPMKRIAYAVSFGIDYNQYTKSEIKDLGKLYRRFAAVSVRETAGLRLLREYDWSDPKAIVTLDPTLLLSPKDYVSLILNSSVISHTKEAIFCYVLDEKDCISELKKRKSKELGLPMIECSLESDTSITQWLANIYYSRLVITDSYHGTIFSILFNKPFILVKNTHRGGSRFDSLAELLGIDFEKSQSLDYVAINNKLETLREKSICFLKHALNAQP